MSKQQTQEGRGQIAASKGVAAEDAITKAIKSLPKDTQDLIRRQNELTIAVSKQREELTAVQTALKTKAESIIKPLEAERDKILGQMREMHEAFQTKYGPLEERVAAINGQLKVFGTASKLGGGGTGRRQQNGGLYDNVKTAIQNAGSSGASRQEVGDAVGSHSGSLGLILQRLVGEGYAENKDRKFYYTGKA